ncbi:prepilin-type N-terminal cleavage/methylation domain-containing protein [Sporosarcina sp. GW1-11]|nr:prepilin-type N-terminal cleavage/methylation domain-containing protein [Sporosarcina sp. GW1-11]
MKKFIQKKLNQKGLTLVELLAVIVILGIIDRCAGYWEYYYEFEGQRT